ncbi:MAG: ParA family protein [Gammaproteobacteria bacterium]|nr:ParA family protein [Gammaproteobacteria bacterium]
MTLNIPGHQALRKILVLNPKGGSGQTTLAMNLAGYFASLGRPVAHAILVPVLPSAIDIHAASRSIADLLLVANAMQKVPAEGTGP